MYIEGTNWDEHNYKFNSLIAQLAKQNVSIQDRQKKSIPIRSRPESLPVICPVSSAQADMTIESLDALIGAELDRKRNSNYLQGLNRNSIDLPEAIELNAETMSNLYLKFAQRNNILTFRSVSSICTVSRAGERHNESGQ